MKAQQERSTNWLTNPASTKVPLTMQVATCCARSHKSVSQMRRLVFLPSTLDVTSPSQDPFMMHRLQHSHASGQHPARMGASASFLRSLPHRYPLRQHGNRSVQVSALPHPTYKSTPLHVSYHTVVCFNSAHRQMQALGTMHQLCRGCPQHRSQFWWVCQRGRVL
jgi:hypothetical protein